MFNNATNKYYMLTKLNTYNHILLTSFLNIFFINYILLLYKVFFPFLIFMDMC